MIFKRYCMKTRYQSFAVQSQSLVMFRPHSESTANPRLRVETFFQPLPLDAPLISPHSNTPLPQPSSWVQSPPRDGRTHFTVRILREQFDVTARSGQGDLEQSSALVRDLGPSFWPRTMGVPGCSIAGYGKFSSSVATRPSAQAWRNSHIVC